MAEHCNGSENGENACEMKSNVQASVIQHNRSNLLSNHSESSRKTYIVGKIGKIIEKMFELRERIEEFELLTTNLLQEYQMYTVEKNAQEKGVITSGISETSNSTEIRNRLLMVYTTGKDNESVFEKQLDYLRDRLQKGNMKADEKAALQQKLSLMESMMSSLQEHLTTIETLMQPDYDILCQEDSECFNTVMTECNRVDDSMYKIASMILKE